MKIYSVFVLTSLLVLQTSLASAASQSSYDEALARLQKLTQKQQEISASGQEAVKLMDDMKTAGYVEDMPAEVDDYKARYAAKVAATQAKMELWEKTSAAKIPEDKPKIDATVTGNEEVDLFGNPPAKSTPEPKVAEKNQETKPEEDFVPVLPFNRQPVYTAPAAVKKQPNNRGRRPFIRSEVSSTGQQFYIATISSSNKLMFAKESGGSFSGYNEQNEFIFSDNLAAFCQINTTEAAEGKMVDCQNKIILEKSKPDQASKNTIAKLLKESNQDEVVQGYSKSLKEKQRAASYEANVLQDMQEQFSEATTERDDIQNNALALMEQTKTINRLVGLYAVSIGQNALKNMATFEITGDLTNIDDEYNAEAAKK